MATEYYYECPKCNIPRRIPIVFDALRDATCNNTHQCPTCHHNEKLLVIPPFGLGADKRTYCLVKAYLPERPNSWNDNNGKKVEYYPFLLVLEDASNNSHRTVWLPYWHLHYEDKGLKKKYGQWAPHMDIEIFSELIEKAKKDKCFEITIHSSGWLTATADLTR